VISAAEFPPQPDPHEKIAELRRQIAHEIEKLSHDTSPSVRRLRTWLELQLESDARVRARLEQRELDMPHKGGKARKRVPGIWQRVLEMVKADPKITATAAWESFPQDRPGGHEAEGLIYRCSGKNRKGKLVELLVEVNDRTGKERGVAKVAFRRYVTEAKKEMRSKSATAHARVVASRACAIREMTESISPRPTSGGSPASRRARCGR
jgi:hypothetical protein